MKDKSIKIHFFYVVLILTSIIIAILSIRLGDNTLVVNYIGFAATIASLLLAFLAIIYSYLGNSSQVKIIDQLNEATNNLITHVEQLPQLIGSVDEKISVSQKMILDFQEYGKVNLINNKKEETIQSSPTEVEIGKSLIKNNSYYGIIAIYVAKLSYEKKKAFSIRDLCEKNNLSYDYMVGHLVALNSIDLIDFNHKDDVLTFININPYLRDHIKNELIKRINDSEQEKRQTEREKLEEYFA